MKSITILALLLFFVSCADDARVSMPEITKTVESIGGCNSSGTCGVKFTDGTFSKAEYPTIGQQFYGVYVDHASLEVYVNKKDWEREYRHRTMPKSWLPKR